MIKYTRYSICGHKVGYELICNGYCIYYDDELVLSQIYPNIAKPWLSYELNAILQIKDLCGIPYDLEEEIKNSLPLSDAEQTQVDLALKVEYLICLAELNN